MNLIGVP